MTLSCEILDVFKTTLGIIAGIAFEQGIPHVGMILSDSEDNAWRIKGLRMSTKEILNDEYQLFWDCILEPINHEHSIEKGDFMFYVG
jgi:hypothetical protein